MSIFFGSKERQQLEATITAKQAEIDRLTNILAQRDELINELRLALGGNRHSLPFLAVGDSGDSGAEYEKGEPSWL